MALSYVVPVVCQMALGGIVNRKSDKWENLGYFLDSHLSNFHCTNNDFTS